MGEPRRFVRWTGRLVFAAWAPCALFVVAMLGAGHWSSLPKPEPVGSGLVRALRERGQADASTWLSVHFLYSKCRCSRNVVEHLTARRRLPDVREIVVLVGSSTEFENALRGAGYELDVVTPVELARKYHVEAAPLMAVVDPRGSLRYLGGYTDRKQGLDVRDVNVIRRVMHDESVAELPLFGCAVSKSLQRMLDPLGLKYRPES